MRRRWLSHAVALLCIVYVVALLIFHQHLGPFTGHDRRDPNSDLGKAEHALPVHRFLGNSSHPQGQAPRTLKLQLQQLEAGMTKLEEEISHVKSKLTQDINAAPRNNQPPEMQQQQLQQQQQQQQQDHGPLLFDHQRQLQFEGRRLEDGDVPPLHDPHHDDIAQRLHPQQGGMVQFRAPQLGDVSNYRHALDGRIPEVHHPQQKGDNPVHGLKDGVILPHPFLPSRDMPHYHQQDVNIHSDEHGRQDGGGWPGRQSQQFLSDRFPPGVERQAQRDRRLRHQQDRFYRQPFNGVPPALPDGVFLPGDHLMDVQGLGEDTAPEEDFTNSSLVKIAEGVAVYAAYHDDRQPSKPTVRLILIVSASKSKRRVLCHFQATNLMASVEAEQYELCENHKKKYLGFIYSCPVPEAMPRARYRLSLSSPHHPESRVSVPVMDVSPAEIREGKVKEDQHHYKYNFSVCVSPLFGSVLAKRLVEFLELTRLLGVQQVFFYDFQLSSVIQRLLAYYQKKGYVSVLPWKLPAGMSNTRIWYHGQLVTNNDCLYRTMPLSAYTAFHDIDEFIVPHHPHIRTLGELLPPLLPNDTCGYSFQSAFYDPGITANDFPDDLMTVALTARPAMLSKIRTKVLVAPRRVFEVGIHHISKQFREHWAPRRFDNTRAILHHYRQCIHDYGMRCENWVKDTTIRDRYLPELKTRMQDVVRTLRL